MCIAAPPPMRRAALPPLAADRAPPVCHSGTRKGMTRGCSVPWKWMGGLGLRSALRMAPAAFWASWADALPMLQQRLPELTRQVLHVLEGPAFGCLGELREATERLDRCGFVDRPDWEALRRGLQPRPPAAAVEPGEWQHGWQYYASSSPFSGDGACPIMCRRPGSCEVAFGSLRKSGVVWMSNITRVRSETAHFPNCRVGTVAPPVDDHGGDVRMPTRSGRQRSTQNNMSPIRQTSFTGRAHGTHPGPRVSRSGRHRDQHQVA